MIALPGLTLATGRHDTARKILETFGRFLDQGMLPNVFPGQGGRPEYNTADATLWFIEAWRAYVEATGDRESLGRVFAVLAEVIDWHLKGTRYGIGADPADGLLRAGEPGMQLTWMDAKVAHWVVTPRIGKPVEINALWFNALVAMAGFANPIIPSIEAALPSATAAIIRARSGRGFSVRSQWPSIALPAMLPRLKLSSNRSRTTWPTRLLARSAKSSTATHRTIRAAVRRKPGRSPASSRPGGAWSKRSN
jgi:hypothetical protein